MIRLFVFLVATLVSAHMLAAQEYSQTRIDSLKTGLNAAAGDDDRMRILNELGRTFWRYQPDSAIRYGMLHKTLAEQRSNRRELEKAIGLIGYMYEIKGDYAESWKYRLQDEKLASELGDSTALAFAYYGLGNLSIYIGNYPEALDYHLKALRIRERGTDQYQLGWSYTNVGYVYSLQGLKEQAIEYRHKALVCFQSPGISNIRARDNVMRFLAEDYLSQKQFDQSIALYKELLEIKKKRNDPLAQIAYTEEELGWALFNGGKFAEAILHYNRALEAMRSSDVRREPFALIRLAKAQLASGNTAAARENASRALDIGNRQHRPDVVSDAQWVLAEIAEVNGRLPEAIDRLKSYWAIRDSIFSKENQIKVAAREAAYQVEKQQREIERLEQQTRLQALEIITQTRERNFLILVVALFVILMTVLGILFRSRQRHNDRLEQALVKINESKVALDARNAELQKLNREKDFLFSIIGHDLRNPFNAVVGLSATLKEQADSLTPDEIAHIAARINANTGEVLELLGNLLAWARFELASSTVSVEPVQVCALINQASNLFALDLEKKNIHLVIDCPGNLTVQTDPNGLAVVVRNLLSNAIKFSNEGSRITIVSKVEQSRLLLSIADEGIGMNPETVAGLFTLTPAVSRSGTHLEAGTGLGLLLCRRFADLAGGSISVASTQGEGTTFLLNIPC
jgi:signal transduction histidine kinase